MDDEFIAWVSWRIQQLRVEHDLTRLDLSIKAGLHENAIALLERMEREAKISTMQKVIAGFEMSPAEFFAPMDKAWQPVQSEPPRKKGRRGPRVDIDLSNPPWS
jgi:transcriptional regulator with XRE-family HTH domain